VKASVIGGGTWGSAFAYYLGEQNIETNIWIREKEVYEETHRFKENKTFLPGIVFSPFVSFFYDMKQAVLNTDIIFIAVPSKFCREIYARLAPHLSSGQIIVSMTKGIEEETLMRMSEIMEKVFFHESSPKVAVLSGPSFAREVAESHPTAVVIASKDPALAKKIQHLISSLIFRVYTSQDVSGVEISGALKNVIAIASGISDGLQFGSNSMAALVTRGISEMTRLGLKLGARMETFAGLAGIGDLVLTCTGKLSRNRFVGHELGKGKKLDEILSNMTMIAEGITTTLSAHQLASREKIEMPICEQVYEILYKGKDPRESFQDLMARKLKEEFLL
jgi:glycerol-3-phosphate dehydrogenase (NAD(P)+)